MISRICWSEGEKAPLWEFKFLNKAHKYPYCKNQGGLGIVPSYFGNTKTAVVRAGTLNVPVA